MSNAYNRLFIEAAQTTPDNTVLEFTSETEVANFYGLGSMEAALAGQYFHGAPTGATMMFTREGLGQRPHLIGGNLSGDSLAQLQAISGPMSLVFDGYTYDADVDLAAATSFKDAVDLLRVEINANREIGAETTGTTITPVTVTFTAWAVGAQLHVESVQSGTLEDGGIVAGAGIKGGSQIIEEHQGADGGAGYYSTFASMGPQTPLETMTETYGIMTVGHVTSGTVRLGQAVDGPGIPTHTAIDQHLGGNVWLVDNAQTFSGDTKMRAPPLSVAANHVAGQTEDRDYISIQPQGDYGFDQNPSALSFASGSAADLLGLTQASGALDSSPGGQHPTVAQFLNQVVAENNSWASFQNIGSGYETMAMETWASKHAGYDFLGFSRTSTPPAGAGGWGTEEEGAVTVGHGPGPGA